MTEFKPMRRKRQQLSEEDALQIIRRNTAGTLALLDADGYPYAVPISYVYNDGKFYFHSALKGHKVDAIAHCDKASFCIIDRDEVHPEEYTTYFRSVIAFGRIRIISDETEKMRTLRLLGNRYFPDHEEALQHEIAKASRGVCMIELNVEHLTGKEAIELVRAKKQLG